MAVSRPCRPAPLFPGFAHQLREAAARLRRCREDAAMMSAVGWWRAVRIGRGSLAMGAVACAAGVATVLPAPLRGEQEPQRDGYVIAFASFAPLDSDIFIADADGSNARPLVSTPGFEANASFSSDGRWMVFSSDRAGSWDI